MHFLHISDVPLGYYIVKPEYINGEIEYVGNVELLFIMQMNMEMIYCHQEHLSKKQENGMRCHQEVYQDMRLIIHIKITIEVGAMEI